MSITAKICFVLSAVLLGMLVGEVVDRYRTSQPTFLDTCMAKRGVLVSREVLSWTGKGSVATECITTTVPYAGNQ